MALFPDPTALPVLEEHFLQFYESDAFLLKIWSTFVHAGLRAGKICFLFATKTHYEHLQERLTENGVDVHAAQTRGEYIWLDASEIVSKVMLNNMPEPERFARDVEDVIVQANRDQQQVCIFSEMAALLWEGGNLGAAIRLEEHWNELYRRLNTFSLFSAYPMHSFDEHTYGAQFLDNIQQHFHILPAGNYSLLVGLDERLHTITLLQSKAEILEAELGQREETEKRLRTSEEALYRLAAIVESSDDAIVSKTLDGIITSWNAAAERLFGYNAEEAIGKHITLIIPPNLYQEEVEIIANLRQGKRIDHYETVRMRKDGTYVDVSLSISPIRGRDGKVIGASKIARDISERRDMERRKDEFIGMASHELKTPVTSLKGFTYLLQRRIKNSGDEEAIRFLARMSDQIDKLTTLVNDLLSITKMQRGQLDYRMEVFNLAELVQETTENIQGTTQTHRLILEKTMAAFVPGDRDRIGQVLTNLLTNAIKYSRGADRVMVRMTAQDGSVVVSVQDFGIGIAPEHQPKIFERFYQVGASDEKTYPGLGIGLYICKSIIERHQGRIYVQSRKGEGATFSFHLPITTNANLKTDEEV